MSDPSHIWHPYTRFSALSAADPIVMERADGSYLYDVEGRAYLDAVSSWWCVNLGHGRPEIIQAIQQQTAKLQHSILGNLAHPGAIALARRIVDLMPSPQRHVSFASDGASANEAALRIAVQYFYNQGRPEKNRFVALTDPYHGDTLGAVSVGYQPTFHQPIRSLLFDTFFAEPTVEALSQVISENADVLAGVILEPLCQGAAGMKIYPPEVLQAADTLCKEHDVLLIIDEIAMGFGRTGSMFAFEQAGIDPDIVTLGKALTNGSLPISACVTRDHIYETFTDCGDADHTFYHGHTFAGNPIACAAALATLNIFANEPVLENLQPKAARIAAGFEQLLRLAAVKEVRCLGMIGAVELENDHAMPAIRQRMLDRGILIRPLGSVVYITPPLTIADADLERLMTELQAAIDLETRGS
ncbi:MAG: adenosylmethionine-8-amino-7-oxononanoate aminotransferase [Verrucomicrobiales bacterium]|jgi:adenosylmethionine-8-amino-7-oxononanoate aminotransferase